MGLAAVAQASRARLRPVARLRLPTRRAVLESLVHAPAAIREGTCSAGELRTQSIHLDRPVGTVGVLRYPNPGGRLAVSQRRTASRGREPLGRPVAAAVRDLAGRRHSTGALPVGPPVDRG